MIVRLDLKGEKNGFTVIFPVDEDLPFEQALEEAIVGASKNLFDNLQIESIREHLGLE